MAIHVTDVQLRQVGEWTCRISGSITGTSGPGGVGVIVGNGPNLIGGDATGSDFILLPWADGPFSWDFSFYDPENDPPTIPFKDGDDVYAAVLALSGEELETPEYIGDSLHVKLSPMGGDEPEFTGIQVDQVTHESARFRAVAAGLQGADGVIEVGWGTGPNLVDENGYGPDILTSDEAVVPWANGPFTFTMEDGLTPDTDFWAAAVAFDDQGDPVAWSEPVKFTTDPEPEPDPDPPPVVTFTGAAVDQIEKHTARLRATVAGTDRDGRIDVVIGNGPNLIDAGQPGFAGPDAHQVDTVASVWQNGPVSRALEGLAADTQYWVAFLAVFKETGNPDLLVGQTAAVNFKTKAPDPEPDPDPPDPPIEAAMVERPPLEMAVALKGPGGQIWRLSPGELKAGDRPLDLSFATEAGEGFATGQINLRRPYDSEFPDLALLNEVVAEGQDGQVAYEGRIQGTPRSLSTGGPEIRLDCQGWMSHASAQPFTDLLVDRDLGAWGEPSLARRANRVPTYLQSLQGPSVDSDDTDGPAVRLTVPADTAGGVEAWYRAPAGAEVSEVRYAATGEQFVFAVAANDAGGSSSGSGNLTPPLTGAWVPPTARPFLLASAAHAKAANERTTALRDLAVIGTHELPVTPEGEIGLSDAIEYLFNRYAPRLDTSQIAVNTFPVGHAVWREPVTVHDAVKQLNVYSQWALGAWENRQVEYRPFDLSSFDWEVQAGIDGVEVETQGVTVEDAFNGVIVQFTGFDGADQIITPDQAEDLQDPDPAIAANQWGERAWTTLQLSNPQTPDGAIQIARMYLADLNRPKFPSTITVPGHIRDRNGRWQPAWRVRANQTISVRNHPNDRPRLITSTSWQGNQLQITTDNALNRMEAILTRLDRGRNPTGGN